MQRGPNWHSGQPTEGLCSEFLPGHRLILANQQEQQPGALLFINGCRPQCADEPLESWPAYGPAVGTVGVYYRDVAGHDWAGAAAVAARYDAAPTEQPTSNLAVRMSAIMIVILALTVSLILYFVPWIVVSFGITRS